MMKFMYLDIETLGLSPRKEKVIVVGIGTDVEIVTLFNESEEDLLFEAVHYIKSVVGGNRNVVMVTYNGDAFDVPYLVMRGLVCGMDMTFLYDIKHIDLMWLSRKYLISQKRLKLHDFAGIYEIKSEDKITGKGIPLLYENKLYDAIKQHCESDVKLLMQLSEIEEIKQLIKIDLKRRYRYVDIKESESL